MATTFTRTHGANARAEGWDDYAEERAQTRGNWLPLEDLEGDDVYAGTPRLRSAVAPRREATPPGERTSWLRRVLAQTAQAAQPAAIPATRPHIAPKEGEKQVSIRGVQVRTLAMVVAGALVLLVAYVLISTALEWVQVKMDDLQYGRPRTMQLDAYVGHGESEGMPSHFIAMNLNRRVTVVELPGGDPSKAVTIVGPYLFGQNEDLTPVQISSQDVNGDGKPDLIVTVKSEQLIYVNDGTNFKLMSAEERATLERATRSKVAPTAGAGSQDGASK